MASAITPRFTTPLVLNCDVSSAIFPNFYGVNLVRLYDVNSAPNKKLPRRQQQKVLDVVSAIVEQFKRKAS